MLLDLVVLLIMVLGSYQLFLRIPFLILRWLYRRLKGTSAGRKPGEEAPQRQGEADAAPSGAPEAETSNEVMVKWMLRYQLGKAYNQPFQEFAGRVLSGPGSRPSPPKDLPDHSAHRGLPDVYKNPKRRR